MKTTKIYQRSHGGYYLQIDSEFFQVKGTNMVPIDKEMLISRIGESGIANFTDISGEGEPLALSQAYLIAQGEARKASAAESAKKWEAIRAERERKIASGEIVLSIFEKIKRHAKTEDQGSCSMPNELFKELLIKHPEVKSITFNYYDCDGQLGCGMKCHPYILIEGEKHVGIGYAPRGHLNKYYKI